MALDPVEVQQLLEAAPKGPWEWNALDEQDGAVVSLIAPKAREVVMAASAEESLSGEPWGEILVNTDVADLLALVPELAADWLRLRALLARDEMVALSQELGLYDAAGASEGNPE